MLPFKCTLLLLLALHVLHPLRIAASQIEPADCRPCSRCTLLTNLVYLFLPHAAPPCAQTTPEIEKLKKDVETFAMTFPTIGFEKAEMRYKE